MDVRFGTLLTKKISLDYSFEKYIMKKGEIPTVLLVIEGKKIIISPEITRMSKPFTNKIDRLVSRSFWSSFGFSFFRLLEFLIFFQ